MPKVPIGCYRSNVQFPGDERAGDLDNFAPVAGLTRDVAELSPTPASITNGMPEEAVIGRGAKMQFAVQSGAVRVEKLTAVAGLAGNVAELVPDDISWFVEMANCVPQVPVGGYCDNLQILGREGAANLGDHSAIACVRGDIIELLPPAISATNGMKKAAIDRDCT